MHTIACMRAMRFACLGPELNAYASSIFGSEFSHEPGCRGRSHHTTCAMAQERESVQVVSDVVSVHGGFLKKATKYSALLLDTNIVGGTKFFCVDKRDTRLTKFLGGMFDMVDFLILGRNNKVQELMCDDPEADPMESLRDVPAPATKRQRKERIDNFMTPWITVQANGVDVKVLPSVLGHDKLAMELTQANVELLLARPLGDGRAFPIIDHPKIHWHAATLSLWAWYFDKWARPVGKWRRKLHRMAPQTTKDELQRAINVAVVVMHNWLQENHTPNGEEGPIDE